MSPKQRCLTLALLLLLVAPLSAAAQSTNRESQQPDQKLRILQELQTAHTMFGAGDYDAARKHYLAVLPVYPKNFDILNNLAYCYYRLQDFQHAVEYYTRAYEVNPNSQEVGDRLARSLSALKRYDEAAATLRKLAEMPRAPAEMWKRTAEAYTSARQWKQAEAAYDAYLQRNPGDLQARTSLGKLYTREKDYTKALEQFRLALSVNPNFVPALVGRARLLAWQGDFTQSLQVYEQALRFDPSNGEALSGKAFVLLWSGQTAEARDLLAQLHTRYPDDSEIARALREAEGKVERGALAEAKQAGDVAQLTALYQQRLQRDPKDFEALKSLARLTADKEHCQQSIDYAQRGLQISSDDSVLALTLARSQAFCEKYDDAIATYQRFLASQQVSETAQVELGRTLLRADRVDEATNIFRHVVQFNPLNSDAKVALAQSLAIGHHYSEALEWYNEVLKSNPDHYDALQGKAYVLYWTKDYDDAQTVFESLAQQKPSDDQNREALQDIAAAQEAARWAALKPASDAAPQDFADYYQKRLQAYPDDINARKGLGAAYAQMRNYPAAVQAYRQALDQDPTDRGAKRELAALLAFEGQYDESIGLYRNLLSETPNQTSLLEETGRVYIWSGHYAEALPVYQTLATQDANNMNYQLEVARLQLRVGDAAGARTTLDAVLKADPQNEEANLQQAQLDAAAGDRVNALAHYEAALRQDPNDSRALYGKAQLLYYEGHMNEARDTASQLVQQKPDSFDNLYLLAVIERARHNRKEALSLLDRADQVSPNNSQVAALRETIRNESAMTLTTSANYARELGQQQDLRMFGYRSTLGFDVFPRTASFFSVSSPHSWSPGGGIQGAVGPASFLYRQSTRVNGQLTVRAGAGLVRFGPGDVHNLPGQPEPLATADTDFLAQGGVTYSPSDTFSFDFDVHRSPITYTPTSVRFGVMENRVGAGLNFYFTGNDTLRLDYAYANYASMPFDHVTCEGGSFVDGVCVGGTRVSDRRRDHDHAHVVDVNYTHAFLRRQHFSLDAGYEGQAFGYVSRRRDIFLGYFNPQFYQTHDLTLHVFGNLAGPVDYDFSGGFGVQQEDHGGAIRRGFDLRPQLSWRVNRHLTIIAGYTHYTSSQTIGTNLRGNSVTLTTAVRF